MDPYNAEVNSWSRAYPVWYMVECPCVRCILVEAIAAAVESVTSTPVVFVFRIYNGEMRVTMLPELSSARMFPMRWFSFSLA